MPRASVFDVAVIGAGTAGLTAAVAASLRGLTVCVCERKAAPLAPPGETLHPGCEAIFDQLGIAHAVAGATTARHLGTCVTDDAGTRREPFGEDAGGPWRGYQLPRGRLHRILMARARDLGAEMRTRTYVRNAAKRGDEIHLVTPTGPLTCRWLLDGTGPWGWSAIEDRTGYEMRSPRLTTRYGYTPSHESAPPINWPSFQMRPTGWSWRANLGEGLVAWVDLEIGRPPSGSPVGTQGKAADVSWRIAREPARGRILRVGDAALRVDPAAGRGVLRAMMSAIMAVHCLCAAQEGAATGGAVERAYSQWIRGWFAADCNRLTRLYGARLVSAARDRNRLGA